MFTVFGAVGQSLYNIADARHVERTIVEARSESKKNTWLDSEWSPVKVLSDRDYGKILEEQLLRVDAEMALMDERIATLNKKGAEEAKVKVNVIEKTR